MLWTETLATGIPAIDEQHKELFRQIDVLVDTKNEGRIEETLGFLEKYIVKHFGDEQRMHRQANYPKAAAHKGYHDAYVISFKKLKDKYVKEGPSVTNTIAVNKNVIGWLREHILIHDKEFAAFYKSGSK